MTAITETAAACCGGSLVLYGTRRIPPERYIRAWRRAIAAARPFAEAHLCGFRLQLFVHIAEAEATNGRRGAFEKLAQQTQITRVNRERSGSAGWEWRFDAAVPEQVKLWRETRRSGPAWLNVEVWGPLS